MNRRNLQTLICGLALTVGVSQTSFAQGNGKGKGHNKQSAQDDDGRDAKGGPRVEFTLHDQNIIRGYYRGDGSNLPPGLAKRNGNLPPGLQKHLERDGTLPPGLQKRVQPFPDDLERRLPRLPDTYRRVTLGVDILILDRRTQRIVDIIHDILRP